MKKIELTKDRFTLVDDADYQWLNQWNWTYHINGARATKDVEGYGRIFMHQLLLRPHGKFVTDHRDGDNLNNQRQNLRYATKRQNARNHKVYSSNKSGLTGVRLHRNKWQAYIYFNSRQVHLGYFESKKEASKAYDEAAMQQFGLFARINGEIA